MRARRKAIFFLILLVSSSLGLGAWDLPPAKGALTGFDKTQTVDITGSTNGTQTDYQVKVVAYSDYSMPDGRFYSLGDAEVMVTGDPANRHGVAPVHLSNIVECNTVIDGASRTYLAYDAHWDGTEVRLYYTDDLDGVWTEYTLNPILGPAVGNTYRTPSVALVGGTFQMFLDHRATGTIERFSSADGINFVEQEDVIAGLNGGAYHVTFIWQDPVSSNYTLYWRRSALDAGGSAVMQRNASDITLLGAESDSVVTSGAEYLPYATVMYRDGKYWLLGEQSSNGIWTVHAQSSDSPSSGFTFVENSPLVALENDEACPVLLLSPDASKCYLYTNVQGPNWYQRVRAVGDDSSSVGDVDLGGDTRTDHESFGDVRFTKADGTTELDYWMESNTTERAVFWVEVDSITASPATTEIQIHYENPTATTTSSGNDTFPVLFDDFLGTRLDTVIWTVNNAGGSLTIADSIIKVEGGVDVLKHSILSNVGYRSATQSAMRFRAEIEETLANFQISMLGWHHDGGSSFAMPRSTAGTDETWVADSDANQDNKNVVLYYFDDYTVYDVTRNSTFAKIYANDTQISFNSMDPDAETIGAEIYCRDTEFDLYCDWILIRKYVESEPSLGAWAGGGPPANTAPVLGAYTISNWDGDALYTDGEFSNWWLQATDADGGADISTFETAFLLGSEWCNFTFTSSTGLWVKDTECPITIQSDGQSESGTTKNALGILAIEDWAEPTENVVVYGRVTDASSATSGWGVLTGPGFSVRAPDETGTSGGYVDPGHDDDYDPGPPYWWMDPDVLEDMTDEELADLADSLDIPYDDDTSREELIQDILDLGEEIMDDHEPGDPYWWTDPDILDDLSDEELEALADSLDIPYDDDTTREELIEDILDLADDPDFIPFSGCGMDDEEKGAKLEYLMGLSVQELRLECEALGIAYRLWRTKEPYVILIFTAGYSCSVPDWFFDSGYWDPEDWDGDGTENWDDPDMFDENRKAIEGRIEELDLEMSLPWIKTNGYMLIILLLVFAFLYSQVKKTDKPGSRGESLIRPRQGGYVPGERKK